MDISLFEYYDKNKLQEVLNCDNIPYGEHDDPFWKEKFKKSIIQYSKKKFNKVRGIEIKYTQPNKYGRYIAKNGLQLFQRDVRKYISGEYTYDLDFCNCHPNLLIQLFKSKNIYPDDFLIEYTENKTAAIKKNKIKDKLEVIKVINNENTPTKKCYLKLHTNIYTNLLPLLLKESANKTLMARIKAKRRKANKKYNFNGAFIADYLQNLENILLQSFYSYCIDNNVEVQSLFFDGLTVSKQSFELTDDFLIKGSEQIFEDTNYEIKIVSKSTTTDWIPIENKDIKNDLEIEDYIFSKVKAKFLYEKCLDEMLIFIYDDNNSNVFFQYINKFFCFVDNPHSYGHRRDSRLEFKLLSKATIEDKICYTKLFNCWIKDDNNNLTYDEIVFDVEENLEQLNKKKYLNLYLRPKMNIDVSISIFDRCPIFFDFIKSCICDSNEKLDIWFHNWIAMMVQKGRTEQSFLARGKMGVGKGSLYFILKLIIGEKYCEKVKYKEISNKFNADTERLILIYIDEVPSSGFNNEDVMNYLLDSIDSDRRRIEGKGRDPYHILNVLNYFISGNYGTSLRIDDGNRRLACTDVNDKHQQDNKYFAKLRKEVKDNIEYLRHYYYTFKYNSDLNSIRPKTETEINMNSLTKKAVDSFLLTLDKTKTYEFNDLFLEYKHYCLDEGFKFPKGKRSFKNEINFKDWKVTAIQVCEDDDKIENVKYTTK